MENAKHNLSIGFWNQKDLVHQEAGNISVLMELPQVLDGILNHQKGSGCSGPLVREENGAWDPIFSSRMDHPVRSIGPRVRYSLAFPHGSASPDQVLGREAKKQVSYPSPPMRWPRASGEQGRGMKVAGPATPFRLLLSPLLIMADVNHTSVGLQREQVSRT